eukprot:10682609-Lingulodinium_polyedra.AAC.1
MAWGASAHAADCAPQRSVCFGAAPRLAALTLPQVQLALRRRIERLLSACLLPARRVFLRLG